MTRFGSLPDESVNSLSAQSVRQCLIDAGAEASKVGAVYFSNAAQGYIENQHGLSGQMALRGTGLEGLPIVNVENGGASASTAFWLARNHVLSGQAELVLAVGTEKMIFSNANLSKRACKAANGHNDSASIDETLKSLRHLSPEYDRAVPSDQPARSVLLQAMLCRAHMSRFGTTQRQLAVIAAKNHANSDLNPNCHDKRPFSVAQILAAPPLSYPLTLPMWSCVSDGSAAALLGTANALKRLKGDNKAIRVDSCVLTSCKNHEWEDFEQHLVSRAASRAYAQAGIGPEDVDIAEVHDTSAFGELLMTELLGFCELGGGGRFAESGASMLNGRLPINTSGGLQSKGHPIGATGLGQIYELVTQLRKKAGPRQVDYANVAVQENGGGLLSNEDVAAVVTVLSR